MSDVWVLGRRPAKEPWTVEVPVFNIVVALVALVIVGCCGVAALSVVAGCPKCVRDQTLHEGMLLVPGATFVTTRGTELVQRGSDRGAGDACQVASGSKVSSLGGDHHWGPAVRLTDMGSGERMWVPVGSKPYPSCPDGVEGFVRDVTAWSMSSPAQ